METAHKNKKLHVLITEVGSYLGTELTKSTLGTNCVVYGVGSSHLPHSVLSNHEFTLLEVDLSQPLPAYLPEFDIIFDLSLLTGNHHSVSQIPQISPQIANTISLAKRGTSKVFIFVPITTSEEFYDYITHTSAELKEKVQLFLVGDLYGPNIPTHEENKLIDLIRQAQKTDKVILKNEGLDQIYPAYITDVVFAVNKFTFSEHAKKIHYLVSQGAKTAISIAYEIQNTIRITANKEIGLFFTGPQTQIYPEPEISVKVHDLGFSPKIDLAEGLKKTFEYLASQDLIEEARSRPHLERRPAYEVAKSSQVIPTVTQKSSTRLPRIPTFSLNFKFKNLSILILLVLLLTFGKTALDLVIGQKNIQQAQQSLASGDFTKAQSKAKSSQKSFAAAANKVKIATYPLSFILKKQVNALNNNLKAAVIGTSAAAYFIQGSQSLAQDLAIIAKPDIENEGFDLEIPSADFNKAYLQSSQALNLLTAKNLPFKNKINSATQNLEKLRTLSLRAFELTNLTDDFIGSGGKKTYLVLLQNNTELRPGGGFIGNYALLEFDEGRLKNVSVEDIYTIDGQLKEKIQPPEQLKQKLGIDNLYLRDSNWSGDFELNARTARDFFKKETGKDVDGLIALDLTLVQNILSKMGPITLPDYAEQINADNLFERGEYYSEVGFFPGSTQKRDFFGSLTRTMLTTVIESLNKSQDSEGADSLPWLALIEGSADGLLQKHLMLTFDNSTLASFIKTKGWNNPLPPIYFNPTEDVGETRDFVSVLEANLGANKVNRFLDRKISYEMTIGKDADLVGKLVLNYQNNSQAETWPGGKYVTYLRVYVPFAASLFEFKNGEKTDLKEVETTTQGNLTVFSTFVEVPIKSQKEVVLTYRIPKNIKLETAPTYSVYFQKQAGTDKDPLEFKFDLPGYLEIKKVNGDDKYNGNQNISVQTDLATDKGFTINLEKK